MNSDILYKSESGLFSYRVAGVLIHDGRILLQRTPDDPAYAYPGGHVSFGETSQAALIREFQEEAGIDIQVNKLLWVGEVFFPWGSRACHQIGLYYLVNLISTLTTPTGTPFHGIDEIQNSRIDLEFSWIPLESLSKIEIYPLGTKERLLAPSDHIEHFVFRELQP